MAADGSARTNEIARGFLLVCVFHVHFLYGFVGDNYSMQVGWFQLKLLAPDIALFFLLSGLSAQELKTKRFSSVLGQSVFLQLLAIASHIIGVIPMLILEGDFHDPIHLLIKSIKPIVYGTGYSTYVAWFFTVLALTRLIINGLARYRTVTIGLLLVGAALCYIADVWLKQPNLYEWRNLPAAVLLYFIGMNYPRTWRMPTWLLTLEVIAWLPVSMINSSTLLQNGLCFNCDPNFVAQPMVGEWGNLPAYALYLAITFTGLYRFSQLASENILGNTLRYFGRNSMQLLLLHGWLLIGIYGLIIHQLPQWDSPFFYAVVYLANPALHAGVYMLVRSPIKWLLTFLTRLTKSILDPLQPKSRTQRVARPSPQQPDSSQPDSSPPDSNQIAETRPGDSTS